MVCCSANTAVSSLCDPGRALPARCPWAVGFGEALGSGVLAVLVVLAVPQLTSFTAPLPALQVTHGLLCAPTSRRQVPTHSAHSWHSRLCRAGAKPCTCRSSKAGGHQEHPGLCHGLVARTARGGHVCPWGFPRGRSSSALPPVPRWSWPGQPVVTAGSLSSAVPVAFLVQCRPSLTLAWV